MAAAETAETEPQRGRERAVERTPDASREPARRAQPDATTAGDGAAAYGWYAEIELRSFMKRLFEGSDQDHWVEPNPRRAQFYDPLDLPDLNLGHRCGSHEGPSGHNSGERDLCPCNPYKYERRLRQFPQFEVSNDRVVVPMSTMEQLDPEPMDDRPYSREFQRKILFPLVGHMAIIEDTRRERPGLGTDYDGEYDNFQTSGNLYALRGEKADERYGTLFLTKPDPRPIYVRVPPDHPLCELNQIYENRVRDNRTLYALIVGRDAATGTGKTTLGVQLAKSWDRNGWTAERATLDPREYYEQYTDEDTPPNSCLVLDEAEQAADNRRSMNTENIKLSHLWATMRFREIYSICTMPSASTIDKRLKEYADLYIVVHERGLAMVYKTKVDDIKGERFVRRLHRIRWTPLDDDPDYQELSQKKAQRMKNYAENFAYGNDEEDVDPERVRKDARKEKRDELIERMAELGYRQEDIGAVVGLERSSISKILSS